MLTNFFFKLIEETKIIKRTELLESIHGDLCYIFAGLFYFISYFRGNFHENKDSSSINGNNNTGIIYIYNEGILHNYNPYKIIMLIILLSLIRGIHDFHNIFVHGKNVFQRRLYFLFFIPLFSKFILKENIFKHQYFSLIIAIIGIIFLLIPVCLELKNEDIIPNILNFINGIIYSLFLVIIKFIIEKYYISPLKIGIIIGIISIFINFIFFIIYSLIESNDLSFIKDCFNFKIENKLQISIYIILYTIFYVALNLLTLLSLFYFSPTLIMIIDIISPFLLWIAMVIKEDRNKLEELVLNPIGYLIVFFAAIIYNEIIIFNFCGLNKNTRKFVNQRINEELNEIKKNKDELLSDDDN